jgi:hypothetical protein
VKGPGLVASGFRRRSPVGCGLLERDEQDQEGRRPGQGVGARASLPLTFQGPVAGLSGVATGAPEALYESTER